MSVPGRSLTQCRQRDARHEVETVLAERQRLFVGGERRAGRAHRHRRREIGVDERADAAVGAERARQDAVAAAKIERPVEPAPHIAQPFGEVARHRIEQEAAVGEPPPPRARAASEPPAGRRVACRPSWPSRPRSLSLGPSDRAEIGLRESPSLPLRRKAVVPGPSPYTRFMSEATPARLPVLAASHREVAWLDGDGAVETLTLPQAAAWALAGAPPVVCHMPAVARRLRREPFAAHDALELFAFGCAPRNSACRLRAASPPPSGWGSRARSPNRPAPCAKACSHCSPNSRGPTTPTPTPPPRWARGWRLMVGVGAPRSWARWGRRRRGGRFDVWNSLPEWSDPPARARTRP